MREAAMSNCPACGAPLTLRPDTEGFQCDFCHKVFFPDHEEDGVEVSGETSEPRFNCPICFQPLLNASLAKTAVLHCTQCHGLLMRMEIVSDLVDDLRANLDRSAVQTPADGDDLKHTIQCPKCNLRMDAHRYAGPGNVVVDTCDRCSLIWLDRGEITRIARAPDNEDFERTYGFN
jgi:Zn-finger nucleic acid-binding protein